MDTILTAMTTFLALTTPLVLFELVAGVRLLRSDRPVLPPASHREWSTGALPSTPYAGRR